MRVNRDPHLTPEEVALYLDRYKGRTLSPIPPRILRHLGDCFKCKREIMEFYYLEEEIKRRL